MIQHKVTYTYSDLTIAPKAMSSIRSRSECYPKYDGNLPIFTAPMDSVVSIENLSNWVNNGITPIVPRTIDLNTRLLYMDEMETWVSFSLSEFEELFCKDSDILQHHINKEFKVVIDVANGHQAHILTLVAKAKEKANFYNVKLTLMAGNIANSRTYLSYCSAGIDYCRVGIGGGSGCLTASNTGVYYGLASLIDECKAIKNQREPLQFCSKIVADGGIRNYSDAIIALALGADYVMIGGLFGSFYESAAPILTIDYDMSGNISVLRGNYYETTGFNEDDLKDESCRREFVKQYGDKLIKPFYGMSTKKAQQLINPEQCILKTSEGKEFKQTVKYTTKQWCENFEDYLKSAMSYTNCRTLDEFKNNCTLVIKSQGVKESINR